MKMMKMLSIALCACAMVAVTGCNKNTPEATAVRVLEALRDGKADSAFLKENCTDTAAMMFGLMGDKLKEGLTGAKFTVTETKVDGDKATVKIKTEGAKEPEANGEDSLLLKKVDGKWKVDIDKEGMGGAPKETPAPAPEVSVPVEDVTLEDAAKAIQDAANALDEEAVQAFEDAVNALGE